MDKKNRNNKFYSQSDSGNNFSQSAKFQKESLDEEYFSKAIIQTSPAFFVAIDAEGKTKVMNHTMLKALGYTAEEVEGTDYLKTFVPEEDREKLSEIFSKLINLNKPTVNENNILTKNGEKILIEWHGQPVYDENGRFDFFFGVGIDITERNRAEIALRKSEERFKAIFNRTFQFIGIISTDGILMQANQTSLDFYELSDSDVIGKAFCDSPWWSHSTELKEKVSDAIKRSADGEFIRFEVHHPAPDGILHYVDFSIKPWLDENGNVMMLIAEGRDITDRKKTEEALNLTQEAIDGAAEAIFWVRPDGTIGYANDLACDSLGYTRQELLSMEIPDIDPDIDENTFNTLIQQIRAQKTILTERRLQTKSGSTFPIELRVNYVEYSGKEFMFAFARDITNRKLAEKAIKDSKDKLIEAQRIAQLGHYVYDIKSDHWSSSAELNNIMGIDEDYKKDLAGWMNILHPDYKDEMLKYFQDDVIGRHKKFDKEYKILDATTGQEKWVNGLGNLIFDNSGNPVEMFGTIQDITDSKLAEMKLRESEEKLSKAFESNPTLMLIFDLESNKRLMVNQAYVDTLGVDREEAIGKTFEDFNLFLDTKKLKEGLQKLTQEGYIKDFEAQLKNKNGEILTLLYNVSLLDIPDRKLAVVSALDITDRKKAEEELRERERTLDALINAPTETAILVDTDGKILAINKIGAQRLGKTESEIIGLGLYDYLPPKLAKSRRAKGNKVTRSGKPIRFQDERQGRYFDTNISPVFDKNGKVTALAINSRDVTRHRQAEIMLRTLVEGTAKSTGQDFFDKLVKHLANSLNCKHALIGVVDSPETNQISTIAYWNKNKIGKNFSFDMVGTPCEKIATRNICFFKSQASKKYPKDKFLAQNKIETYLGLPILNPKRVPIGILVVMDTKKFPDDLIDGAQSLMEIFASRAAAELERIHAEKEQLAIAEHLRREQKALFDKHVALKQILEHMEAEKSDFKHQISTGMEQALMPFVKKLRTKGGSLSKKDMELFEDAIKSITGSEIDDFKTNYAKLTSREMDICEFIKEGKSSQEIANKLHLSLQTIQKHRSSIRKKLQLKNKEINLPAYLRYK